MFENYSWDHSADNKLAQVFNQLFSLIKKYSSEIHVFTTNYDIAVEEYCSKRERNYRCIDGFRFNEYTNRRIWEGVYDYPRTDDTTNVCLYKLHGSPTWKKLKIYGIEATSEEARSSDQNYLENLLVYPTLSPKAGKEIEPYKTIREKFRKFIEGAELCIVIGFSFRDEHVNSIFSDFFRRGKSIVVLSPSADKSVYTSFLKRETPEPEQTVQSNTDETKVCLFRENGRIITINQPLTSENSTCISSLDLKLKKGLSS